MFIHLEPKFQPGQTVVCIDDDFAELLSRKWSIPTFNLPVEGRNYVIRAMIYVPGRNDWGVLLQEIRNGVLVETGCELNFSQNRFRKPDEQKMSDEESGMMDRAIEKVLEPQLV